MPVIGAGGGREAGCGQHVDFRKRGVGEKRTDVRGHEVGEKRVAIGAPTCGYFFRASEPNCGIWDETYCLQVCCQFIWESKARVLIDYTPGAGAMAKAALMLNVKAILVAHNEHHKKLLARILTSWVSSDMKSSPSSQFRPQDADKRLEDLLPEGLVMYREQSKKRGATTELDTSPEAKRQASLLLRVGLYRA